MYSMYTVYSYYSEAATRGVFVKKAAHKNFTIFIGKHIQVCNFFQKRLQHKCFPVINAKFLRAPILKYMQTAASENLSGAAILIFRRYFRSSSLLAFYKLGVLKTSVKFLGTHICQGLISISCRPSAWNFIKLKTASWIFFN